MPDVRLHEEDHLHKRTALLLVLLLPVLLPILGLLLALSEPKLPLFVALRSLLLWPGDIVMFFLSSFYLFKPQTLLLKEGAAAVLCLPWYCVLLLPLALFVRRRWTAALALFIVLAALHFSIGGILGVLTWGLRNSTYRF